MIRLFEERRSWVEPYNRRELVRAALRGRCRDEGNWILKRRHRYTHTAKAILLILLGRRGDTHRKQPEISEWAQVDPVEVAWLAGGSYMSADGTVYWGEEITVGKGWRHWFYDIEYVSS